MQKFPAEKFNTTIKISFNPKSIGEKAGLIIFGSDYAYIAIENSNEGLKITKSVCNNADKQKSEIVENEFSINDREVFLRADIYPENEKEIIPKVICSFSYSNDGKKYFKVGNDFIAKAGKWVGAKIGLFSIAKTRLDKVGFADFDWIKFQNLSLN